MKCILGILPSIYSLYFLNYFLREQNGQLDSIVVANGSVVIDKRTIRGLGDLRFLLKRFGVTYVGFLLANQWLVSKVNTQSSDQASSSKLWSLERLCHEFEIDSYYSHDFNSEDTIDFINSRQSDYFLINGCNQILSAHSLDQLNSNAINIHPSLLPDDRGVDPVFQKLLRKEYSYSTSLHQITPGIDRGPIYQQLEHHNDQKLAYLESSMAHAIMASKILTKFSSSTANAIEQKKALKFGYRSWPLKNEINQFKRDNGQFISKIAINNFLNFDFRIE
jgi:methionyl-tRNA formyltransferase